MWFHNLLVRFGLHRWGTVFQSGNWLFQECVWTGQRRVVLRPELLESQRTHGGAYGADLDQQRAWLAGGEALTVARGSGQGRCRAGEAFRRRRVAMTDEPISEPLSTALAAGDTCPRCLGELDTGWECNDCGYDARPLVRRADSDADTGGEG